MPVATPLLLNTAWRNGTITYKAITPTRLSFPNCVIDNRFRLDSPKCRGSKIVVANGQMLRHSPVATTSNAGATGIKISQNNTIPKEGKNNKQVRMVNPATQTADWTILHITKERGDNCLPRCGASFTLGIQKH